MALRHDAPRMSSAPSSPERPSAQALRLSDPYLERERARYQSPLPSREWILSMLEREGVPVPPERLVQLLDIDSDEEETFARRLNAMERDGQIMRNRRGAICIVNKLDLIRGRVQGHPDGYGFLIPDDGSPDLFLSPWEMSQVLHGDRVMARQSGVDRRGRAEGVIVEVLERANRRVVGRLMEEHGICFVVAENKRISQDILVPREALAGAKPGRWWWPRSSSSPTGTSSRSGAVVEVLGNYADPGMEIEIALRKHDLPHEFPDAAQAPQRKLPTSVRKTDLADREDLRNLPLVTIDGETAKDFDDAVFCRPEGKGFRLWVAIADVSHYVRARRRARHRSARARQLGVFSAPRDPDAAGGAVQRPVLAEPGRGPAVHGV